MINKKFAGFVGMTGVLAFFIAFFSRNLSSCSQYINGNSCVVWLDKIVQTSIIFIPFLFFTIILYKMSDVLYRSWVKFASIWVVLTLWGTLYLPTYTDSIVPITKGVFSFFMSLVLLLISLILIFLKHQKIKKQ